METQVAEASGEASGESHASGGFGIIVEAAGHAVGSAMRALHELSSVDEGGQ